MKHLICTFALSAIISTTSAFELTSTDIQDGQPMTDQFVFNGFGCSGQNRSPQLSWHNPPQGTQSYAITAYDPNAPTGSGWWHWVVVNIPAQQTQLAQGAILTQSTQTIRNDFGTTAYGGACPPKGHGVHHYQFTVWALPISHIDVTDTTTPALIGYQLNAISLAKAKLTATYAR